MAINVKSSKFKLNNLCVDRLFGSLLSTKRVSLSYPLLTGVVCFSLGDVYVC